MGKQDSPHMYLPLSPNPFLPGVSPGVFSPLARSWSSRCFPGGHIPFGRSFNFQASPVASNAGESVRILQQKKSLSRISKRMEKTHKI